jgi:hypothetical protein
MTITELLERIRRYYLNKFEEQIQQTATSDENTEIIVEPTLLDESGEAVKGGFFNAPYRTDLVLLKDEEVTDSMMVDTESMLGFNPVEVNWTDELTVTIHPFQWNYAQIVFPEPAGEAKWQQLENWSIRWFERADFAEGDFSGVVHYISDPEMADGKVSIMVDLGSAPVSAMEDLFHSLSQMQVEQVEIR